MSGTTLGQINAMRRDEGFAPQLEVPEPVGGQRVTRFQGFLDDVEWTEPGQVARALRVLQQDPTAPQVRHPSVQPTRSCSSAARPTGENRLG